MDATLRAAPSTGDGLPPTSFESRVLGGTYRVLQQIGRGAMGVVYEAQHLRLHRHVAVKVLPAQLAAREDLRARFEQEADMVSRIRSRHVVDILDYDVTPLGEPYLVLELLEGETLSSRLARPPCLTAPQCVSVVRQIALGLSAAHRSGVVHRDLKPDNVFLVADADEGWFVKLLDFGIGKSLAADPHLTAERLLVGTPDYMAPEQAVGNRQQIDSRTDQHALAVLAYELLTGRHPFASDDFMETLHRVASTIPTAPSELAPLPTAVDDVLARALCKDPDGRYAHVTEFADALASSLEGARAVPPDEREVPASGTPTGRFRLARAEMDRADAALAAGDAHAAAAHAGGAFDLLEGLQVDAPSEAVLERAFLARVGPPSTTIAWVSPAGTWSGPGMSPRTAFLLSRLEQGMTVGAAFDVAAMPRLEALRRLAALVEGAAVRFGDSR